MKSATPAAVLSGDELGAWEDMQDLKRKARGWYRDNLQGKTVKNAATGWDITFTRAASGKIGGKPIDYLLRKVPALQDIVEKAEKVGEAEDRLGSAHVRKVHYFKCEVIVGGRQETIHIVVREMDNGRMFYDLNLGGNVGPRTEGPMDARDLRVEPELQIGPDTLNIALGAPFDNPSVPSGILRGVSDVVGQILRAHVAVRGGRRSTEPFIKALDDQLNGLHDQIREIGALYLDRIGQTAKEIEALSCPIDAEADDRELARRLRTIPGVRLVTEMAVEAFGPAMETFDCGRDFSAWLGLVPRQHSSGGKPRLGRTAKMCQRGIRRLLISGAMSIIHRKGRDGGKSGSLLSRKSCIAIAIARANKLARII